MEKEEADKVQRADEAADGSSEPTQGGAGGSKKNRRRRRGKKDNSGDKGGDADAGAGGGSGGSENMGELAGLSEAERQAAAANVSSFGCACPCTILLTLFPFHTVVEAAPAASCGP